MWRPTEIFRKKPAASSASASPSRGHENARIGKWGEDIAACFLRNHGWDIVGRRVRPCKRDQRCEIDVIARKGDTVAFVEVKRRGSNRFGRPAEAVTPQKRQRIVRTAQLYLQEKRLQDVKARFDIIEILPGETRHIENAFDAPETV